MSLVLRNWEPFSLLKEFNNSFFENRAAAPWSPNVNISESEDGYLLTAELPGVKKEDVDIDLKDNTLTIKGEKKAEKKEEKENYIRVESSYGKFQRSFYVSDDIDISKADASFKDGVLRIKLVRKEEAKPKEVKVEIK